jgi:small-conductance mechanosensitive channel/CRP-like cAMP-binding protein
VFEEIFGNDTFFWMFGFTGALILLVILAFALSPTRRAALKFPGFCLASFIIVAVIQAIADASPFTLPVTLIQTLALLLLLLAVGRLAVLAAFDLLLTSRLNRPVPRIIRDTMQGLVYAGIFMFVLRFAGVQISSLLVTSAFLTAVIGLALQETLGNIVAGLTLQAQQPFQVGDWVQFDDDERHVGEVLEINWRATKILTLDQAEVTVPNGLLARNSLVNFTKPTTAARRSVYVAAPYSVSPSSVHEAALSALADVPGVAKTPAPSVVTYRFLENATIQYWVRYFITDFSKRDIIDGEVRSRLWYALERAGTLHPFPVSTVLLREMERADAARLRETGRIERLLGEVALFTKLTSDQRSALAAKTRKQVFAPGEVIVREGEEGKELFVIHRGQVKVTISGDEVSRMSGGKFFGEMSVLTGERRTATVVAVTEVELLAIGRVEFQELLEANSGLAEDVSRILALRQMQLEEFKAAHETEAEEIARQTGRFLVQIRRLFSLKNE